MTLRCGLFIVLLLAIVATGARAQGVQRPEYYPAPPTPVPATLAASGTWNSGLIRCFGYLRFSVGLTSTQAGSLAIVRYVDTLGTVPMPGYSITITANTPAFLGVTDGVACGSFRVTAANTGGSPATLTNLGIVVLPN